MSYIFQIFFPFFIIKYLHFLLSKYLSYIPISGKNIHNIHIVYTDEMSILQLWFFIHFLYIVITFSIICLILIYKFTIDFLEQIFLIILKSHFFSFYNVLFYPQQAFVWFLLRNFCKVHDHIVENLPICLYSCKNNTLKKFHS